MEVFPLLMMGTFTFVSTFLDCLLTTNTSPRELVVPTIPTHWKSFGEVVRFGTRQERRE